jgi:integrase
MKIPRIVVSHGRYYRSIDTEERKPNGKRRQKWVPLTRVDEGEQALMRALAELSVEPDPGTMPVAIADYMKAKARELTPGVATEYRRMFAVITQAFVDFRVDQVRPGDVLDFVQQFGDRPTARRAYKARLSGFFAWCVLTDRCPTNPCAEIRLAAPPARTARFDAAAFWALRAKLPPQGQAFLDLLYLTRQRPTDIRLLRDSQMKDGHMHFRPSKTARSSGASVSVPITAQIEAAVKLARSVQKVRTLRDGYVIASRSGHPYTKEGLYKMWATAREAAGLAVGITTRDVRPFALAELERAGATPRELQIAAAHTDFATTEGYIERHRERISVTSTLPPKPV